MSVRRYATPQGHPVPERIGMIEGYQTDDDFTPMEGFVFKDSTTGKRSPGLFDPAINARPQPMDMTKVPPTEFPPGATCLNGMQGVDLYSCDSCGATVTESEFDSHVCGQGVVDHGGY